MYGEIIFRFLAERNASRKRLQRICDEIFGEESHDSCCYLCLPGSLSLIIIIFNLDIKNSRKRRIPDDFSAIHNKNSGGMLETFLAQFRSNFEVGGNSGEI